MSNQLERLAIWTSHLIRANYDYREHCCEFSKFLVQNVPFDYWPDVAAQLILMLDDIDSMNAECVKLIEPLKADLVKAVAKLNLPKPDGHLSWTAWIVDHWIHLGWKVKLGLQAHLSAIPSDPQQWFHQMSIQVRNEPEHCKDIARHLFSLADRFVDFDDQERLINLVRAECLGLHALMGHTESPENTPAEIVAPKVAEINDAEIESVPVFISQYENDRPIRFEDIEELCVGRFNRVGKLVAKNGSTCRGWQYAKGWPNQMTWQSVRKWVNERKSFDFGDPPKEC